jgi:hypothetical protein
MNEDRFWAMIEDAWKAADGANKVRQKLLQGKVTEKQEDELMEAFEEVIPALSSSLEKLSREDLLAFDQILERKLYDIDRAEIHEHTEGSDDGFLYARGFIVAAGRGYYDAVNARPAIAAIGLRCEEMCYLSWHIYEEQFGKMPNSKISRESCSNGAGWP